MDGQRSGLAGLIVLLCLVAMVPGVLVLAAWQQHNSLSCSPDAETTTDADTSVPLRSGTAGAPLSVPMATWNVLKSNRTSRIVAGLQAIGRAGADVIAVQELQHRGRARVAARMRDTGWAMSDGNTATPVLWRTSRYRLLAQGRVKELGVVRIEPGSAAGSSIGPKYIQWVQLQDKTTGGVFIAASHHLIPGIESKGRPDRHGDRRVAHAKKQILTAGQTARRLGHNGQIPFLIGADWNIDARKDARIRTPGFPYTTLPAYGLYSNWRVLGYPTKGTHGSRLIDAIFATTRTIAPVRQQILDHYGSDHRATLITFTNHARNTAASAAVAAAAAAVQPVTQASQVPEELTVPSTQEGETITLRGEQVSNAEVIITEGQKAGVPEDGWVIAIATALQESGLRNLNYGDRAGPDSRGIFQQRTSTGWGTIAQTRNPQLAAQAFYGTARHTDNPGLTDIPEWQTMPLTQAAQAVQHSGTPTAYAKWENTARAIVGQLNSTSTGTNDPSGCEGEQTKPVGDCPATGLPVEEGLTPDALRVLRCVKARFPSLTDFGGKHPDPLPDHPSGRAVDVMIPGYQTAEGKKLGWQIAHWLKDNHPTLGVQYVIFDATIWAVEKDSKGWRPYRPGYTSTINDSSMHRNHVHVTTYGHATEKVSSATKMIAAGAWTKPLDGGYVIGCAWHCYINPVTKLPHAGQDFEVPIGTPVRSTNTGIVETSRDLTGSYGRYIMIRDQTNPQITIYYAHLSRRDVRAGDPVTAGQVIGRTGSSGNSTGPHLHYEIRINGEPVNPVPVLARNGVTP